ncbi:OTU protein [Naganishia albida]|nr:OTU protein [Naganishia albida]
MPGSKRRALKNLLSPHNASPVETTSTESSLAPAEELSIVTDMEQRQHAISPNTQAAEAPPAPKSPTSPIKKQLGGFAGLYGRKDKEVTAEQLAGDANGNGKKKSSKQRFLEREARKKEALIAAAPAVDEAANAKLDREKAEEEQVITQVCNELGVQLHEIEPDGHCMYSAIADQLHLLGLSRDPSYHATRHAAAKHLVENADAFMPFVASIHGEDMAGATDDGMMTPEGYREYCKRVEQSGDWGGEIEIQALSKYYNIPIHVIQHGPPHIISHTPVDEGSGPLTAEQAKMAGDKVVRISYHRRMYGLGEHYNSLRPKKEVEV